jgi:hypothetical protein
MAVASRLALVLTQVAVILTQFAPVILAFTGLGRGHDRRDRDRRGHSGVQ